MTGTAGPQRLASALADATGRSEEEVRVAVALVGLATLLVAGLRMLKYLSDLGTDVVLRPHE